MTTESEEPSEGAGARAQALLTESKWRFISHRWGLHAESSDIVVQARRNGSEPTVVKRGGRRVYPGCQFVDRAGAGAVVAPACVALMKRLTTRWSEENVVLWACSPNAYLEGRTPAEEVQSSPNTMSSGLLRAVDQVFSPPPWF